MGVCPPAPRRAPGVPAGFMRTDHFLARRKGAPRAPCGVGVLPPAPRRAPGVPAGCVRTDHFLARRKGAAGAPPAGPPPTSARPHLRGAGARARRTAGPTSCAIPQARVATAREYTARAAHRGSAWTAGMYPTAPARGVHVRRPVPSAVVSVSVSCSGLRASLVRAPSIIKMHTCSCSCVWSNPFVRGSGPFHPAPIGYHRRLRPLPRPRPRRPARWPAPSPRPKSLRIGPTGRAGCPRPGAVGASLSSSGRGRAQKPQPPPVNGPRPPGPVPSPRGMLITSSAKRHLSIQASFSAPLYTSCT